MDKKKSEIYYLDGKRHKEDGPAYQNWYKNGQKKSKYHYLNGKDHREDGPAYQYWFENGKKRQEKYYLDGKEYSKEEWLIKLRKEKLELIKEL